MAITIEYPLKRGNARNWPGVTVIRPDAEPYGAIWAQEEYEATLKLNPVNLLKVVFSKSFRRNMEYIGHEIEVLVASRFYEKHSQTYRRNEAEDMTKYKVFKGFSRGQIETAMLKASPEAWRFIKDNWNEIESKCK